MISRLDIPENGNPVEIRKRFDNELGVAGWGTPGTPMRADRSEKDDAPLWWTGEEDASQDFLTSMGVVFTDV